MWIKFTASDKFAIKVYVGAVNAVSGEPAVETAATALRRRQNLSQGMNVQDYVVVPHQRWLDGIATAAGEVRQFVAMPMGSGQSVEAQITGEEAVGGMQFEITPYRDEEAAMLKSVRGIPDISAKKSCPQRPPMAEMNLAPGGRIEQSIARDPFPSSSWDRSRTSTFNVQILNTASFTHVTGRAAPATPIDAAAYAKLGLPFISIVEPKSSVAGDFAGIKPVAVTRKEKVKEPATVPSLRSILFGPPKKPHKKKKKDRKEDEKDKKSKKPRRTEEPEPHVPANTSIDTEFFNPSGPRASFRAVGEIERGLMEVRSISFN